MKATDLNATKPRGIRNYNPGNLDRVAGVRWQGQAEQQTDPRFVQFIDPRWGIRAIARTLITYQDKRRAEDGSRIDSVSEIIARWAPAHENDTSTYAKQVAKALGVRPDDEDVDVYDFTTMGVLVMAIIHHENGPGPLPGEQWYGAALITEALALAGIVAEVKHGG